MSSIIKGKRFSLLVFGAVVCAALPAYAGFEYIPPVAPSAVVPPEAPQTEMSIEPTMPSIPMAPVVQMAPVAPPSPVKNQIIMEEEKKTEGRVSIPALSAESPSRPSLPVTPDLPSVSKVEPEKDPLPVPPPPPARALEVPPVLGPAAMPDQAEPMLSPVEPMMKSSELPPAPPVALQDPAESKKAPLSLKERLFGKVKTLNPVAVPGRTTDDRTQKALPRENYSSAPDLGDLGFERPEKTKNFAARTSEKKEEIPEKLSVKPPFSSMPRDEGSLPPGLISQTVMVPSKEQQDSLHDKKISAVPPVSAPVISTADTEEEAIARAEANRKANMLPPPAPTEARKVTVKESDTVVPEGEQIFNEVTGFGRDLPLALAVTQVVPADYRYVFASGVDAGSVVSWEGGKPWDQVLNDMIEPAGLKAEIRGKEVSIRSTR